MKNYILLLALIFFIGCKSVKVLDKETNCFKPKSSVAIHSTFKNQADSNSKYEKSLLYLLDYNNFHTKDSLPNWKQIIVTIETNQNYLHLTGKFNDSIVYSKSIKIKQKLNYFKTRKIRFRGIPPIFFQYDESLLLFSLTEKGNLSLIHNQRFIGGLFFFMGNNYEKNCLIYSKLL